MSSVSGDSWDRPDTKPKRKLLPWILATFGLIVMLSCGGCVGLLVWLGTGPQGGVRLSNQIEPYASEYLDEHQILEPGERIVAYYDVTMRLSGTEAAILTGERLIYHKSPATTDMQLAEITNISTHKEPLIGHVIEVRSSDGTSMRIEIAPLNSGPTFSSELQAAVTRAGGSAY